MHFDGGFGTCRGLLLGIDVGCAALEETATYEALLISSSLTPFLRPFVVKTTLFSRSVDLPTLMNASIGMRMDGIRVAPACPLRQAPSSFVKLIQALSKIVERWPTSVIAVADLSKVLPEAVGSRPGTAPQQPAKDALASLGFHVQLRCPIDAWHCVFKTRLSFFPRLPGDG